MTPTIRADMTDEQKPTSTALQLLAQIQSVKDGWTLAERDEARAVALAWRPDDGDEYAHMKRLFFVDGWLYHCGRVALARQPAAIDKQDERGAFEAWAKKQGRRFNEGDLQNAKSWALAAWMARAAAQQDEPSTGICFFCGELMNGEHESDCPQAARAASTSANVAQGAEAVTEDISLVRELQKALFYWMPRIAGEDSPAGHKAAEHAYLLIGLDDNSSECYGDQARSSLGIVNRELERIGIACSDAGCPDEMEVADFIADLYARAQAAATVASTDDARECLADVVSHYRALYAGLAFQLNEATVSENSDDMTYWKHEIKALERMYAQAERALTAAQSASGDTK